MKKLTTAASVVVLAAALGAQAVRAQAPATQAPAAQTAPQTAPKPAAAPATQAPATQPPPAAAPAQTAKPAALPAAQGTGRATATVFVTDPSGAPIPDVKITLTGATDREIVTTHEAATRIPNLRSGTYRARFDAPDYILFEKELVLRAGQPWEFEVTLNPAPVKKVEAPPAPLPLPAPKPAAAEPSGEMNMVSLTDLLDSKTNIIRPNEPLKDLPVGLTEGAAASVLQVGEDIVERSHANADEMLYVITGGAGLRIGDRVRTLAPGWFVTIPRGTSYSIERRGRNRLIVLSIMAPASGASAGPR